MNKWSPRKGLGGIPTVSKPLISLDFFRPDVTSAIEQTFFGMLAGGAPFLSAPLCSNAEQKLAWGLGLTGIVWLFTGMNYFAISGAVTSLGAYALCKASPSVFKVKTGDVEIP